MLTSHNLTVSPCVVITYLSDSSCFLVVLKLGVMLLVCFEDEFLSTLDML